MRAFTLIVSALALTSAVACETARGQQEKVDHAQAEADQKIAEANREASEKVNAAQADADKKAAEAQLAFTKLREDYRHDVNSKLADLDKKIADLDVKAKTLKAPKRTELDSKLVDIRQARQAFVSEYQSIETASALTWDDVKKRLDKSWTELEAKVKDA